MNLYQQKIQTLKNVVNHVDNGRMAIIDMAQTWAISYGNGTMEECLQSVENELRIYSKHIEDIYFDGVFIFGINRPLNIYRKLGYAPYYAANDGITLHCDPDTQIIMDDELDRFIADPAKFYKEVAVARRYPALAQDYPEDVNALKDAVKALFDFNMRNSKKVKHLKKLQTPYCSNMNSVIAPALDQYMTHRGIRNFIKDMRRQPEKVIAACEAMQDMSMPAGKQPDFPWAICPVVSVNYLNPKQYEKFFWPTFKKSADAYIAQGAKIQIALEGTWGVNAESLADFPENSIVAYVERDNYFELQKKIGDKVALGYPFPTHLLANGTKAQVVDEAKRIIDKVGGKGTFFSVDNCLLSPNDAKAENYAALAEVSRDYRTK